VTDDNEPDLDGPVPGRTKVISGIVASLVLLVAAYALLRVSSPMIRPDQAAPAGHYSLRCGLCHTLSSDARVIEVAR
jgi:hypothetical protein